MMFRMRDPRSGLRSVTIHIPISLDMYGVPIHTLDESARMIIESTLENWLIEHPFYTPSSGQDPLVLHMDATSSVTVKFGQGGPRTRYVRVMSPIGVPSLVPIRITYPCMDLEYAIVQDDRPLPERIERALAWEISTWWRENPNYGKISFTVLPYYLLGDPWSSSQRVSILSAREYNQYQCMCDHRVNTPDEKKKNPGEIFFLQTALVQTRLIQTLARQIDVLSQKMTEHTHHVGPATFSQDWYADQTSE